MTGEKTTRLIVAASYSEAVRYADENGFDRDTWNSVNKPQYIRDIKCDEVHFVGTWRRRLDAEAAENAATECLKPEGRIVRANEPD